MTEKAKEVKRYEKSTKERKKVVKERKVDEEKARILEHLMEAIAVETKIDSVKNEAEFSCTYLNNAYTVKLVKHRPPKAWFVKSQIQQKSGSFFVQNYHLTNRTESVIIAGPRMTLARPFFHYTTPVSLLSIDILYKFLIWKIPKFVHFYYLQKEKNFDILIIVKGRNSRGTYSMLNLMSEGYESFKKK